MLSPIDQAHKTSSFGHRHCVTIALPSFIPVLYRSPDSSDEPITSLSLKGATQQSSALLLRLETLILSPV